jgi:FtsH-binding integral membrane protein
MAFETERRPLGRGYDATLGRVDAAPMDVGLRQYMLRVYNYMASGLFLSALVALLVANNAGLQSMFFQVNEAGRLGHTGLGMIAMFTPLGLILAMSFGAHRMKTTTLQALYWAFVATMGVGLSMVLMKYTGVSVIRVLLITSVSFGALSLYGYTTKKNLSAFGTFLFIGLIGLVIASVVQIFVQSAAMHFIISAVGVLIFAGLTAFDTQRIKGQYLDIRGSTMETPSAVMGAVALYLNFVNLFQFLMSFLGQSRE